jgi:hypothetical protein
VSLLSGALPRIAASKCCRDAIFACSCCEHEHPRFRHHLAACRLHSFGERLLSCSHKPGRICEHVEAAHRRMRAITGRPVVLIATRVASYDLILFNVLLRARGEHWTITVSPQEGTKLESYPFFESFRMLACACASVQWDLTCRGWIAYQPRKAEEPCARRRKSRLWSATSALRVPTHKSMLWQIPDPSIRAFSSLRRARQPRCERRSPTME